MKRATPTTNGTNGRDATGRFAKGNAGGPGNPHARQVAKLRSALFAAVTDDDVQAIATKLIEQAKGGDLAAVKLLLSYAIGKPGDAPADPDRLDEHEATVKTKRLLARVEQQLAEIEHGGQEDTDDV